MTSHVDNPIPLHGSLLSRHGHLTMLALDRFDAGELPRTLCEEVIDHLDACDLCAARIEAMRAYDEEVSVELPASRIVANSRFAGVATLAVVGVAAAVLLLAALPTPHQASREPAAEGLTASAYSSSSEQGVSAVYRGVAVSVRTAAGVPLTGGERVSWDDALQVTLQPAHAGYVGAVVVSDVSGEPEGTGGMNFGARVSVLMPMTHLHATSDQRRLSFASEPAGVGAEIGERLFVLQCAEQVDFELVDFDPEQPLAAECTSVEFEFTRFGEVADS